MPEDSVIVGVVLLGVVPLLVWDAVSSLRAGFGNAFWARPLEAKMDWLVDRQAAWHRLAIMWIPINLLLSGGFTAFAFLLVGEGQAIWSAVGLGVFLVGATAFTSAAALMVSTVGVAAEQRRDHGTMPSWVQPAWRSTWWLERAFIIGANLAYVAWGVAIVDSGFPATWVGWVAIVSGGLIAGWVSARESFFQHMVLITPIALGLALVFS